MPTAMIFDDHDVNDDWNISEAWVRRMRTTSWWEERIIGAFMSYWVYQHLGNLSPRELEEDGLFEKVRGGREPPAFCASSPTRPTARTPVHAGATTATSAGSVLSLWTRGQGGY